LSAGSEEEDQSVGLRLVQVQDDLSLGVTEGWRSEPGSVEGTVGSVELTDETGPSGNILLLFGEFGFFLDLEVESEHVLSEGLLVLVVVLLLFVGVDDLHLSSLWVDGWVEFVMDDGGVWDLVVGGQVDGSTWGTLAEMGGGDGQLELTTRSLAGDESEGSLHNDVTLNSSLVLLASEGALEGQFTVDFPGVNWGKISLEGDLGRSTDVLEFDCSTDGDEGGHSHVVNKRESHDCGHGSQMFSHMDGLLVVDLVLSLSIGTLSELFSELLNCLLVESPETFDLISDSQVDGSEDGFVLFTGFNVQQVLDVMKVLVSLQFLLSLSLGDGFDESTSQLLDGVSSNGDL